MRDDTSDEDDESIAIQFFKWLLDNPIWEILQSLTLIGLSMMTTINFWRTEREELEEEDNRFDEIVDSDEDR